MVDFGPIGQMASIGTLVGILALVTIFWLALKQMQETNKLNKVQLVHRFRPWIGPSSGIDFTSVEGDKTKFSVTIKNYGELPASNVVTVFTQKSELPAKEMLKESEKFDKFNLGPLLPNMEKRYWFFVSKDLLDKTKVDKTNLYVLIYFSYEYQNEKSGYGMISQYDPASSTFMHKEMWVD